MANLWLKIKVWTKGILFGILFIYVLTFIYSNSKNEAIVWFGYNHEQKTNTLILSVFAFGAGVISTILFRTISHTLRQIRDLRERQMKERFHRDYEELRARNDALSAAKSTPEPARPSSPEPLSPGDSTPQT